MHSHLSSRSLLVLFASISICVFALNLNSIDLVESLASTTRVRREVSTDPCHLREIELCAMGIASMFQNPNGLPVSQAELTRQCQFFKESVECFDNFNQRCVTPNHIKMVEMFTGSAVQIAQDFCREDSDLRKNYTKHVGCFREVQRHHQRHCVTDFQVGFESIHKTNRAKRLAHICCNIERMKECIFVPIDEECGTAATMSIQGLLQTIFGSIYQFPCRPYNSSNPECSALLPKINTKPHQGRNTSAISKIISGFVNVPAQL